MSGASLQTGSGLCTAGGCARCAPSVPSVALCKRRVLRAGVPLPRAVRLVQAWDEFKPYKKENKHTKARERVRASAFSMESDEGMDGPISAEQDSQ